MRLAVARWLWCVGGAVAGAMASAIVAVAVIEQPWFKSRQARALERETIARWANRCRQRQHAIVDELAAVRDWLPPKWDPAYLGPFGVVSAGLTEDRAIEINDSIDLMTELHYCRYTNYVSQYDEHRAVELRGQRRLARLLENGWDRATIICIAKSGDSIGCLQHQPQQQGLSNSKLPTSPKQ